MAAATLREEESGGRVLVLTSDRDAFQLVSERVTVLAPRKGIRDLVRVGPAEVFERFGVKPDQVADFKALAGDASDKIPGAKGVGPQTAAALLAKHGELVLMQDDVEVALPSTGPPDLVAGARELRRLGAERAAERVERLSAQPGLI